MNGLTTKTGNIVLSKELVSIIRDNGKYGIMLLGTIYVGNLVYDAVIGAMEKGYDIDVEAGKEKVRVKFTQPKTA